MTADAFIEELWSYAREVPMEQHPWFQGILTHRWSREQIILGEVQHYLRVRTNPIFFGYMAVNAVSAKEYAVMDTVPEKFIVSSPVTTASRRAPRKPTSFTPKRTRGTAAGRLTRFANWQPMTQRK